VPGGSSDSVQAELGARAFGRDVSLSVAATGVVVILAFANNVIIARFCGADARGMYALGVAALALMLPVASLGLPGAVVFALGRQRAEPEVSALSTLRVGVLVAVCALGLSAYVLVFGWPDRSALPYVATGAVLPAGAAFELTRHHYLGHRRALGFNGVLVAVTAILVILNLITLRFGDVWVLFNWVASFWLVTLVFFAARLAKAPRLRWPPPGLRSESLRYGLRWAGGRL
jgi:O-antigen/teichoic acid export membrane protein